jgi:hypothetical protein
MRLGFSDDEQRENLATIVAVTKDVTKALDLQRGAMDIARARNVSLATASDAVAKAYGGNSKGLKSLIPGLKLGANAAETLGNAFRMVDGQANAFADTSSGKLLASQVALGEKMEQLGQVSLPWQVQIADWQIDLIEGLGVVSNAVGSLETEFEDTFDMADVKVAESATATRDWADQVTGDFGRGARSFGKVGEASGDMADDIKEDTRSVAEKFRDMRDSMVDDANDILDEVFGALQTRADLYDARSALLASTAAQRDAKSVADKRNATDDIIDALVDEGEALIDLGEQGDLTGVGADWERDGFAGDDDITSDVIAIDISEGGQFDSSGGTPPGSMTLTVKNSDGKYTPDNGSSPLTGLNLLGVVIWFGANDDGTVTGAGTVRGVWAGFIKEIAPNPVAGASETPTATIVCEGILARMARDDRRFTVTTDGGAPSYDALIATAINGAIAYVIESNPRTIHILDLADGPSIVSSLDAINAATGSRHYIQPFDDKDTFATYVSVNRWHKLDSAADEDWNADDIQAIDGYRTTAESVINAMTVTATQVSTQPYPVLLWKQNEPIIVADGENRKIYIDVVPSFNVDADSVFVATGLVFGVDVGAQRQSSEQILLEIGDTGGGGSVQQWEVVGQPYLIADPQPYVAQAASTADYGIQAGANVDNRYVGSPYKAAALAEYIFWKFSEPLARPTVTVTNLFPAILVRQPYDVIRLTFDKLHLSNMRFEIIARTSLHVDCGAPGAVSWTATYQLQKTANSAAMTIARFDDAEFDTAEFSY